MTRSSFLRLTVRAQKAWRFANTCRQVSLVSSIWCDGSGAGRVPCRRVTQRPRSCIRRPGPSRITPCLAASAASPHPGVGLLDSCVVLVCGTDDRAELLQDLGQVRGELVPLRLRALVGVLRVVGPAAQRSVQLGLQIAERALQRLVDRGEVVLPGRQRTVIDMYEIVVSHASYLPQIRGRPLLVDELVDRVRGVRLLLLGALVLDPVVDELLVDLLKAVLAVTTGEDLPHGQVELLERGVERSGGRPLPSGEDGGVVTVERPAEPRDGAGGVIDLARCLGHEFFIVLRRPGHSAPP